MAGLTIIGTGIRFPGQLTLEAADAIRDADCVFYNVGVHPLAIPWIKKNAKVSHDLYQYYAEGKNREDSYKEMVDAMVGAVAQGKQVVGAFYGHPGVFVGPSYTAIEQCRELGYKAIMLPGVSASDCMFSDLEFDPAQFGVTMIEASYYVFHLNPIDTSMPLVLWQAGVVCNFGFNMKTKNNMNALKDRLLKDYPSSHPIVCYMAATLPGTDALVKVGTIGEIESLDITAATTCLLPPVEMAEINVAAIDTIL